MDVRIGVAGLALVVTAGCSEALVFPDWELPIEDGTRVVEYRHVPAEERRATIEWVEELVIGDRGETDVRYAFTRPGAVAVDPRGQIYVVDSRAASVKVFDENGEYLRELGRQGQGPGEFQDPRSIAVLADRVIVGASRNARWSHFDLDGSHIEDHSYPIFDNLELVDAAGDDKLIGSTTGFEEGDVVIRGLGLYSPEAELLQRIVEVRYGQVPTIQRDGRRTYFGRTPRAYPQVAVAPDAGAYWSTSEEYQILAVAADGAQRWALRLAWTPPAVTRAEIDAVMTMVRRSYEDAVESEVNLPDRQPAIASLLVDGHGHLYVFPYVPLVAETPDSVPVDVYSPDGERLFSGMSAPRSWSYADGDHVWEIAPDPETEEYVVRKIRLAEPFD